MKKILFGLLLSVALFGCFKNKNNGNTVCNYTDSQTIAPDSEVQKVKTYLDTNLLLAQKDPSGFFYKVNGVGTGGTVSNLCSVVTVNYKGKLVNGTTFDSTNTNEPVSFVLANVITGWQKGIPYVKGGGNITLYIPPSLGYGSKDVRDDQGNVLLPANSILIFNIDVLQISN